MIKKIIRNYKIIVLFILIVIPLGFNLYGFPYLEGDEGVYTSRSIAFLTQGKLSTSTYWYDHAPLGWMLLSLWFLISRSAELLNSYLLAGRTFILLLQFCNIIFLYLIALKFIKSKVFSSFATAIFSVSPLFVYFGRRVILDNIMLFWFLLSLVLFLYIKNNKYKVLASVVAFAAAVLTKENAIFFLIPYIPLQLSIHKTNKYKKTFSWLIIFGLIILLYPLYALSRGELLPTAYFEEGGKPSLISTLLFQAERGNVSILNFEDSFFWQSFRIWIKEDPILITLGTLSTIFNLLLFRVSKKAFIISLFVISQVLFLMRGGLVFEFYILPVIPFFALNIVYLSYLISKKINKNIVYAFLFSITVGIFIFSFSIKSLNPYTTNQTGAQIQAIQWIKNNTNESDLIIADSYAKGDLYKERRLNIISHFDAQYNWDIREGNREVEYILSTTQVQRDIDHSDLYVTKNILNDSELVETFYSPDWNVQIYQN